MGQTAPGGSQKPRELGQMAQFFGDGSSQAQGALGQQAATQRFPGPAATAALRGGQTPTGGKGAGAAGGVPQIGAQPPPTGGKGAGAGAGLPPKAAVGKYAGKPQPYVDRPGGSAPYVWRQPPRGG